MHQYAEARLGRHQVLVNLSLQLEVWTIHRSVKLDCNRVTIESDDDDEISSPRVVLTTQDEPAPLPVSTYV